MAERVILHIYFDSFFASVEQQNNPLLRGKPIGVTSENGRTAIIAASREAKILGLHNVMRTYDAFNRCPWIILTPGHFQQYFEISKKVLSLCNYFSPLVELLSIDEVFMDVTQTARLFGGVGPLIKALKYRVKKEIGEYITVSVGVSHNKLLAKLASGFKKPDGVYEINHENIWEVYKQVKLTDISGIGQHIALRLNTIGVYTLLQLRDTPLELLIVEFGGIEGTFLKNIGLGIDVNEIVSYTNKPYPMSRTNNRRKYVFFS